MLLLNLTSSFFFLNDTPPTEFSPLPLHDALPILIDARVEPDLFRWRRPDDRPESFDRRQPPTDQPLRPSERACSISCERGGHTNWSRSLLGDRKSTRLNSSHLVISHAVFCFEREDDDRLRRKQTGSPRLRLYQLHALYYCRSAFDGCPHRRLAGRTSPRRASVRPRCRRYRIT